MQEQTPQESTSTQSARTGTPGRAVCTWTDEDIAIVTLGSADERTVSLTQERLSSLADIVASFSHKKPRGLVILANNREMFTVGADINAIKDVHDPELGASLAKRGQDIFQSIESLPFKTVAAISGPCVGGGCELALACDVRIITDEKSSSIGLPEIKLGILPGFGGTQRLPRLIGLPQALNIILSGKVLKPKQARKCGLVNEIVSFDELKQRAVAVASGKSSAAPVSVKLVDKLLTFTKPGRWLVARNAQKTVQRQTKGMYPAPPTALKAVLLGFDQGLEQGYKYEAQQLGRLIVTPESKNLVRIFFLTEASKAIGRSAKESVAHLHTVVIGAGVMGAGIAGTFAKNDCSVVLKDTTDEALSRGIDHIKRYLGKLSYLNETERSFILNRIEATTKDATNTGNANLVIEAIFENLEVKKQVLGEMASKVPSDAIIATNTSSLSVTEIATAVSNPERVVGMHFFNPVEKMPLVEIVRAAKTSDRTIAVVAALTTKLGKFPIVVDNVPGFLVNRILSPYLNEAGFLLQDGYSIDAIDRAATAFGMPMGPVRLLDEVGLDVAVHVSEVMRAGYGDRMRGPGYAAKLLEQGRKGKKSKAGFYDYAEGRRDAPHPEIRSLLGITAAEKNPSDLKVIEDRLVMSLINEAVKCLDEGVAGNPGPDAANQIDLGTVMGMGFPPFRGGLLHYAQDVGAAMILQTLEKLEKQHGPRFTPAEGIAQRARNGRSLCC